MKHPTIPAVPIAVAHLSNPSNPTHNDNSNYPSPMFVVAQKFPPCTWLLLSLRFKIPLIVAQKSPCCGDSAKSGNGPPCSAAAWEGRAPARPKLPRGRVATCCERMERRILAAHEKAAGQRPDRHLAVSRDQCLGQDTQDTQDSQDCAYLVRKLASLSLARKPFPGPQAFR